MRSPFPSGVGAYEDGGWGKGPSTHLQPSDRALQETLRELEMGPAVARTWCLGISLSCQIPQKTESEERAWAGWQVPSLTGQEVQRSFP